MEEKTSTLNICQTGTYQYETTVPETGATKTASTFDSALTITSHEILTHLTTRYLILVFDDQHVNKEGWSADLQECPPTDLERQAAFKVAQLDIVPQVKRRERQLVFELIRLLTREQATWLDEYAGKLFDSCNVKDELEVRLVALPEKSRDNRKATAHE